MYQEFLLIRGSLSAVPAEAIPISFARHVQTGRMEMWESFGADYGFYIGNRI
jgi:hypothetical protein